MEENNNEKRTDAPPEGQAEDVYSASTRVGQAPAEILAFIKKGSSETDTAAPPAPPEPGPPKVLLKTPAAIPVTDFSMPEAKTAPAAAVVPAAASSGVIDDDDWIIPDEEAKPPPPPTPVMPSAPRIATAPMAPITMPRSPAAFAPMATPPGVSAAAAVLGELAAPIPASPGSAPEGMHVPSAPLSRPATPRAAFAPATPASQPKQRIPTPRTDFAPPSSHAPVSVAPVVGAVLGLVDAPTAIPEERASAAKLVAAAPDPNVRVSRVDEEIFSVRNPQAEDFGGAPASANAAPGSTPPMRERMPTPQLGDPPVSMQGVPSSGANPNHLPIAEAPNSMHVPIGEAKLPPSRTPVGAIVAVLVLVVLGVLGAIVFVVLKK